MTRIKSLLVQLMAETAVEHARSHQPETVEPWIERLRRRARATERSPQNVGNLDSN